MTIVFGAINKVVNQIIDTHNHIGIITRADVTSIVTGLGHRIVGAVAFLWLV